MNGSFNKKVLWFFAAEVVLLSFMAVSLLQYSEATASLNDCVFNQQASERLVSDIRTLRNRRSVAEEDETSTEIDNRQLVTWARQSGMQEDQVVSIRRLIPSTIEKTEYQRHDTTIELRSATMEQILGFALRIEETRSTSRITQINLTSDQGYRRNVAETSDSREKWNVQLILTQLVYGARSAL